MGNGSERGSQLISEWVRARVTDRDTAHIKYNQSQVINKHVIQEVYVYVDFLM